MEKKSKILLFSSVIIYLTGLIYGTVIAEVSIRDLIGNLNLEKFMFLSYNLYIFFCFIMLISKKIQSKNVKRRFFIVTSVVFILLQVVSLAIRIYQTLEVYKLDDNDAKRVIGTYLLSPNGFVPSVIIILILFQLYMLLDKDKR
ncbi:hypothetical protein ABEV00_10135 [Paenibacillus thiaminolyticus]|uniref:hypothetical protein n=1 Tax=Paenibacillus thiaminolyticus TaxID=49283 RepID=UPI003D28AF61